ncbi:MAG: hypothetical protein ACOCWJ_06350 [Verrucomicrobiota bacterium]
MLMTDIVKRNIGLVVFLVIGLAAAIVLVVMVKQQTAHASDLQEKVEEQVAFFEKVKREKVAITEDNLETALRNKSLAEARLTNLRAMLQSRSAIAVPDYTGVECKNLLREETQAMRDQLFERRIQIPASVSRLSFGTILDSAGLPDEDTEVPILVKQLRLIQEVVRLAGEAFITEFSNIERLGGTAVLEGDDYNIVPFRVTVTGNLPKVKNFVTKLQRDSEYFFLIHFFHVDALSSVQDAIEARPAAALAGVRDGVDQSDQGRFMPGMPDADFRDERSRTRPRPTPPSDDADEDERQDSLSKKEREVELTDMVTATIRFDFVEFSSPEQEY